MGRPECNCPEVGTSGSCPFHDAWTVTVSDTATERWAHLGDGKGRAAAEKYVERNVSPRTEAPCQSELICEGLAGHAGAHFAGHPPYPTPAEFRAMTQEQFVAFLDRIGARRIEREASSPALDVERLTEALPEKFWLAKDRAEIARWVVARLQNPEPPAGLTGEEPSDG